ncbi:MAG: hypothetical protein Q7T49_00510 [bacterium]|nr:hypothetical protein [bacterium]
MNKKLLTLLALSFVFVIGLALTTTTIALAQTYETKPTTEVEGGTSDATPTPIGGKCPAGYTIDAYGKYCLKVQVTTPADGTKPDTNSEGGTTLIVPIDGQCPSGYYFSIQNDNKVCLKLVKPGAAGTGSATTEKLPTVIGSGSFILTPEDGKCPAGYLTSDDGKQCVKVYTPPSSTKSSTSGEGGTTGVYPNEDGQCPTGYIVANKDGNKICTKPVKPIIYIAPNEGQKEVTIEAGGKVQVVDAKSGFSTSISPNAGLKASVFLKGGKVVEVEGDIENDEVLISTGNDQAFTKESVGIKNNKIFVNDQEIKIMPDTASVKAIEVLKDKDITIELKDVGQGKSELVYEATASYGGKLLGLIKVEVPIRTLINTETGETSVVKKAWWRFLVF